jgi:hypothetical protein
MNEFGDDTVWADFCQTVSAGFHYLQLLERAPDGSGLAAWFGDNGTTYIQSGGIGWIWN